MFAGHSNSIKQPDGRTSDKQTSNQCAKRASKRHATRQTKPKHIQYQQTTQTNKQIHPETSKHKTYNTRPPQKEENNKLHRTTTQAEPMRLGGLELGTPGERGGARGGAGASRSARVDATWTAVDLNLKCILKRPCPFFWVQWGIRPLLEGNTSVLRNWGWLLWGAEKQGTFFCGVLFRRNWPNFP